MTLDEVKELVCEFGNENALVFDDFCDAFVGVSEDDGRAIYDYDLMVKFLVDEEGMTEEEAMDYIGYNTVRSLPYAGPMSPIILRRVTAL